MNKVIIFLTLNILIIHTYALRVFTADQLNNVNLKAKGVDACKASFPSGCCFTDDVKLTISYDSKQINSITFTGNQDGQSCTGSTVVYPASSSQGILKIAQGIYTVLDSTKLPSSEYHIFTSYGEMTSGGKKTAIATFDLQIPTQSGKTATSVSFSFDPALYPNAVDEENNNKKTSSPLVKFMGLLSLISLLILVL